MPYENEAELISRYQSGDRSVLPELFDSFRPILRTWERNTSSTNLPRSAVNAEIKKQFMEAVKTYDPNRGVKPSTHINSRMPKVYRFIYEHQNVGRLPENVTISVGTFKGAKTRLSDSLNREPTAVELADDLGWNVSQVESMEKMIRKDFALPAEGDFGAVEVNRQADLMHYIYYDLTPQEKLVFEHLTGIGGKEVLKSKDIAIRLGVSPSTVSNIKKEIAKKLESSA